MLISQIYRTRFIQPNLRSFTKEDLFDEMIDFLAEQERVPDKDSVKETLWTRERMLSTGIAPYIAIPHAQIRDLKKTIGVLGISRKGILYGSQDGRPVHLVMLLIDDEMDPITHLETVRNAAVLVKNPRFYDKIMHCKTAVKIYHTIQNFEDIEKIY